MCLLCPFTFFCGQKFANVSTIGLRPEHITFPRYFFACPAKTEYPARMMGPHPFSSYTWTRKKKENGTGTPSNRDFILCFFFLYHLRMYSRCAGMSTVTVPFEGRRKKKQCAPASLSLFGTSTLTNSGQTASSRRRQIGRRWSRWALRRDSPPLPTSFNSLNGRRPRCFFFSSRYSSHASALRKSAMHFSKHHKTLVESFVRIASSQISVWWW